MSTVRQQYKGGATRIRINSNYPHISARLLTKGKTHIRIVKNEYREQGNKNLSQKPASADD